MPPSKRAKLAETPSDDEERPISDAESDRDSSSSGGGSSSDDDASQEMQTVQADFAFFDPKPSDFHGVRLLLNTYLDSKPWDLTGFVDLVLEQTTPSWQVAGNPAPFLSLLGGGRPTAPSWQVAGNPAPPLAGVHPVHAARQRPSLAARRRPSPAARRRPQRRRPQGEPLHQGSEGLPALCLR